MTLFVDGLGPVTPAPATGAIAAAPALPLTPGVAAVDSNASAIPVSTLSIPGTITGVSQVQFQLPKGLPAGSYAFSPTLNGAPLRERLIIVWMRP